MNKDRLERCPACSARCASHRLAPPPLLSVINIATMQLYAGSCGTGGRCQALSTSRAPRAARRALRAMTVCQSSSTPAVVKSDPFAKKEVYRDNVFDKFMIKYFSGTMSRQLGGKPYDGTYDSFVELSREIMRGRNTKQQQETVAGVLISLLPPQAPANFRKWFPFNKLNSEINAFITTLGFTWLVGPSKLKKVKVQYQGREEEWLSGVEIKKCRYLENSGCVGMCVNMCKLPTQKFFTETFGLPLTMNPNFEDLSCEMVFGQYPPPVEEDKVYTQPCFATQCDIAGAKTASSKDLNKPCPKIDTDRAKKEKGTTPAKPGLLSFLLNRRQ